MPGYLGNKKSMIVHHLATMKKECKIYEIKKDDKKYFNPDSLDQTKSEGFVSCMWCI